MKPKARGVYEYPKGSGKFWIQYFESGKRHRELIGPEKLAIAVREKRMTEIRENRFFPELRRRRLLFSVLCDEFEEHRPAHWSGGTFKRVRAWFGAVPAATIAPHQIEQKLNQLIEAGRSPATANRYRAIASAIFSWAIRNGKLTANPARAVPLRREENARTRFLSDKEEAALKKAAGGKGRDSEIDLALHTGMRLGEQYKLRWADVDLRNGMLNLLRTKSGHARHIPINDVAAEALRRLRFINKGERVCSTINPQNWFQVARKRAKLPEFRWHDLRHTFASRLVMAGVDIRTVQELMGHRSITMTMRYAHLAPGRTQEAVKKLVQPLTKTATGKKHTPKKHSASLSE